jgi:hypothetical protein
VGSVGAVVCEVDGGAGAVVLAAGVDGGAVEAAVVLGDRLFVERARRSAPFIECPAQVLVWVASDEAFGQVVRLD